MQATTFYQTWMRNTPEIFTKSLGQICFPASHDSASYALQNKWLSASGNAIVLALQQSALIPASLASLVGFAGSWIEGKVFEAVRDLSQTTTKSITEQLNSGIRCLDLRIYGDGGDGGDSNANEHFLTQHGSGNLGLVGSPLTTAQIGSSQTPGVTGILDQIQAFLAANPGEILYITFGHCSRDDGAAFTSSDFAQLSTQTAAYLQAFALSTDDEIVAHTPLFQIQYQQITNNGLSSRAILVAGDEGLNQANPSLFWPPQYSPPDIDPQTTMGTTLPVYGWYKDSDELSAVQADIYHNFQKFLSINTQSTTPPGVQSAAPPAYAIYMTLTPQGESYALAIAQRKLGLALIALGATMWWNVFTSPLLAAAGIALMLASATALGLAGTAAYLTLKELADKINDGLIGYVSPGGGNKFPIQDPTGQTTTYSTAAAGENYVTFLYGDYFEDSQLVDIAIQYSRMLMPGACPMVPVFRFVSADGNSYQYRRIQLGNPGYAFQEVAWLNCTAPSPNSPLAIHAYSYTGPDGAVRFWYGIPDDVPAGQTNPTNPMNPANLVFNDLGPAWYSPAQITQGTAVNAWWRVANNTPLFYFGVAGSTPPAGFDPSVFKPAFAAGAASAMG